MPNVYIYRLMNCIDLKKTNQYTNKFHDNTCVTIFVRYCLTHSAYRRNDRGVIPLIGILINRQVA